MSGATITAIILGMAAIAAIAGYVWLFSRKVDANDLIWIATVAVIASCSAAPK